MQEAKAQFQMGGPLALNLFFVYMIQIVTMAFLGHTGTDELAAASLAMVACNTLGALLFMGLCGATDTLAAQVCHAPALHRPLPCGTSSCCACSATAATAAGVRRGAV